MTKYQWLFYVLGAVLMWGAYVVTIDHGRTRLAQGIPRTHAAVASMRAFLFIGLAYFVIGVIVPGIYLWINRIPDGQDPGFNRTGSILSIIAGILGAGGALCIVFAVGSARRISPQAALFVAPLVFSFAPIVNCIISLLIQRPEHMPGLPFFLGLAMAAGGAALVLIYKPAEAPHKPAQPPPNTVARATSP